jgi:hypothetical protein
LIFAALMASSTDASTPGRSRCRTTSAQVAGVFRERLTTFGGLLVSWYMRTIRTASAAMASCASSVDAPMW